MKNRLPKSTCSSAEIGKERLRARQISARGGELRCELRGDRVHLSGQACFYLEGEIATTVLAGSGGPQRQAQQEAGA